MRRRSSFGGAFDNSFKDMSGGFDKKETSYQKKIQLESLNPYQFFPPGTQPDYSEIRFYDFDSSWSRWRRGYELYCITQSYLGSREKERNSRGDFRMYMTFQLFPGLFIPARIFTFPSSGSEMGEHTVGIRDSNGFNFFDFGLPINEIRYVTAARNATYVKTGTSVVVSLIDHGYLIGENIFLDYTSGTATDETLSIVSKTNNTFTCTSAVSVSTSGSVKIRQQFADTAEGFADPRWTEQRVKIRFMPTPVTLFAGERLADRVIERDPGISITYSQSTTTITVTCASAHGLSTGNKVFLKFNTGTATTSLYDITYISATQFSVTSIISATTSGAGILYRRIKGYDYNDYVGYTVTGVDLATNEILFQRDDSYGTKVINDKATTGVPAHRGFTTDKFLTTEIRYQCDCPDFMRRKNYNLYETSDKERFPRTGIESVVPGTRQNREGDTINARDNIGVYDDFGYAPVSNFYQLPSYDDGVDASFMSLQYYQTRWCKHIYAAMFSMLHDEGTEPIRIEATYTQTGPNVNILAPDHGLLANTKVQIDFTSGDLLDGEYTITSVIDVNNFEIVYPYSSSANGYCTINNLKLHEYVGTWLLEPNDQPIGNALTRFHKRFEKEQEQTKKAAERMSMMGYGLPWTGTKTIQDGASDLPEEIAEFDPNLVTMKLTDTVRRDAKVLTRDGQLLNKAATTLMTMQKVLNLDFDLLDDVRIGLLNQPLTAYASNFQIGLVDGGTYLNGAPDLGEAVSSMDCSTYNPEVYQDINVDSSFYINT
jgi:hypothetical protein